MGRHPVVPGEPATTQIKVRLSQREREALAKARGDTPESTYVRALIRTTCMPLSHATFTTGPNWTNLYIEGAAE